MTVSPNFEEWLTNRLVEKLTRQFNGPPIGILRPEPEPLKPIVVHPRDRNRKARRAAKR